MENFEVKCNSCDWKGYEEDLVLCFELEVNDQILDMGEATLSIQERYAGNPNIEYLKGCPNCHTDHNLQDIIEH